MLARIKFCGITRPADAAVAAELGAAYVGVIFAQSARRVSPVQAREIFEACGTAIKRVGVFGGAMFSEILDTASAAGLDVIQLHSDPGTEDVIAMKERFDGEVWAAIRMGSSRFPPRAGDLFESADAVVLDARKAGTLGGTGQPLPWSDLAVDLAKLRGKAAVALAGGLNPANVSTALKTLAPDIVDVASGVESGVGVKSAELMREFAAAVNPGANP